MICRFGFEKGLIMHLSHLFGLMFFLTVSYLILTLLSLTILPFYWFVKVVDGWEGQKGLGLKTFGCLNLIFFYLIKDSWDSSEKICLGIESVCVPGIWCLGVEILI